MAKKCESVKRVFELLNPCGYCLIISVWKHFMLYLRHINGLPISDYYLLYHHLVPEVDFIGPVYNSAIFHFICIKINRTILCIIKYDIMSLSDKIDSLINNSEKIGLGFGHLLTENDRFETFINGIIDKLFSYYPNDPTLELKQYAKDLLLNSSKLMKKFNKLNTFEVETPLRIFISGANFRDVPKTKIIQGVDG
ncbi:hypothetical protein QTP88_017820 [Uroleucon formosanum]